MDNLESQKDIPEPIRNTFHKQIMEMEKLIKNKYHSKKNPKEARVDALVYAASQLSWWKINSLIDPNSDQQDIEESDQMIALWENAIGGAKNNDWTAMKTALQNYARTAFTSAAIRESWRETNPHIAPGNESQRRADVFVNLINSL